MRALFTSRDGGAALPQALAGLIGRADALAAGGAAVEVQVMSFAFTDPVLADRLLELARRHPALRLRLLADWSQSARGNASMLRAMLAAGLPNLHAKFKLDAPYRRDPETGFLRYSYARSVGMLHHKSLAVHADGAPVALALGSFNWSARGQAAYENVLLLGDDPADAGVMADFAVEFAALWRDHRLSATLERAARIVARMKAEAKAGRDIHDPKLLADILGIAGEVPVPAPAARRLVDGAVLTAFSGRMPTGPAQGGHAPALHLRALDLMRPSGTRRPAPLDLNTLALEAIRSVPADARLDVALYALSARVPEYGALLDAARRGVRLRVLLDGRIGRATAARLATQAADEGLPVEVAITRRRMHQKYLCCPDTGMVLTGTANMTADATTRHSDHRILLRSAPALAAEFAADFETIWGRLPDASRALAA